MGRADFRLKFAHEKVSGGQGSGMYVSIGMQWYVHKIKEMEQSKRKEGRVSLSGVGLSHGKAFALF